MRCRRPDGFGAEEEVGVPFPSLVIGEMRHQPIPGDILAIPEMDHPVVDQTVGVPLGARVKEELVSPEGIDGQPGMRMSPEDIVLHPTGACGTDRSGGREDQDEPRLTPIVIEARLELVHAR